MSSSRSLHLRRRDEGTSSSIPWIAFGAVAVFVILLVLLFNILRRVRIKHPDPPTYIPTSFLKAKWRRWQPTQYTDLNTPTPLQSQHHPLNAHEADVARRQSVRSIMTLPPYHVAPLPSERLIAREGERAGVDTVVEYPESELQAEARREEEMAALYNVRQARRNEAAEREARREERRVAREAGDWRRLDELERESRARARERANNEEAMVSTLQAADRGEISLPQPDSAFLIAELDSIRESASRSRRVSSVSYADLGLARHDGTRIRADSFESDNRPLLNSAASIGGRRSRATSRASSQGRSQSIADLGATNGTRPDTNHTRHMSDGMASYMSADSDDLSGPPRPSLLTPQTSADAPPEPPSYEDDVSIHGGDTHPFGQVPSYECSTGGCASRVVSPLTYETVHAPLLEDRQSHDDLRHEVEAAETFLFRTETRNFRIEGSDTLETSNRDIGNSFATNPSHARGSSPRSIPLPKLQTKPRLPPAIEVMSATPVNSVPTTPVEGRNTVK